LNPPGQDHGEGEHEAADGIGIIQSGDIPIESASAGIDGFLDGQPKDAPGIENSQRQVDSQSGHGDLPSAILDRFHSRAPLINNLQLMDAV
jgi:hypothetical protein